MNQVHLVFFLGTGAGTPSRERNLAAVALVKDGRALLFDCGEGTQQQILRSSVRAGAIEAIFVSHMHGDYLYGLPGLLATMSLHGRSEPLAVFGPERVACYLRGVYDASYAHTSFDVAVHAIDDGAVIAREGYDVHARLLDHTAPASATASSSTTVPACLKSPGHARLASRPARSIARCRTAATSRSTTAASCAAPTWSARRAPAAASPTAPTRAPAAAIELARTADVLVHESTYGNDMAAEAGERGHSTASDAARVAAEAGVHRLILTHISPRYTDAAPLLAEARAIFANTELAADLDEIEMTVGQGTSASSSSSASAGFPV